MFQDIFTSGFDWVGVSVFIVCVLLFIALVVWALLRVIEMADPCNYHSGIDSGADWPFKEGAIVLDEDDGEIDPGDFSIGHPQTSLDMARLIPSLSAGACIGWGDFKSHNDHLVIHPGSYIRLDGIKPESAISYIKKYYTIKGDLHGLKTRLRPKAINGEQLSVFLRRKG